MSSCPEKGTLLHGFWYYLRGPLAGKGGKGMFRLRFRPARRLGNFLVFVGFMLLTGYVILVVTRLFLFPRRVRPMHAILMGLCSWWLLIIPVMLVREQHMS